MFNKIQKRKRVLIRKFFGLFSFTALMFVFQACYGCVDCDNYNFFITGTVTSDNSGIPIEGIEVSLMDGEHVVASILTDSLGKYKIETFRNGQYPVHFADIDSLENGQFLPLDTTITIPDNYSGCTLNVALQNLEK